MNVRICFWFKIVASNVTILEWGISVIIVFFGVLVLLSHVWRWFGQMKSRMSRVSYRIHRIPCWVREPSSKRSIQTHRIVTKSEKHGKITHKKPIWMYMAIYINIYRDIFRGRYGYIPRWMKLRNFMPFPWNFWIVWKKKNKNKSAIKFVDPIFLNLNNAESHEVWCLHRGVTALNRDIGSLTDRWTADSWLIVRMENMDNKLAKYYNVMLDL